MSHDDNCTQEDKSASQMGQVPNATAYNTDVLQSMLIYTKTGRNQLL